MMDDTRKKDGFHDERLLVLPESVLAQAKQHQLVQQLYLTDIGYFPDARYHYRVRENGCASMIVICCVRGKGWFQADGQKNTPVNAGSLVVIPANVPHVYEADEDEPWSICWLHVQGEHAAVFFGEEALRINLAGSLLIQWINLFEECWQQAAGGWAIPNMVYTSQIIRHMFAILYTQAENSNVSTKQNRYLENAMAYMKQRIDGQLSLDDLAAYTRISKPHLVALFKRIAGSPPLDYFLRMKIQQACIYLDFTDWSVKEIGASLGFQDPYYFSRQFRKVMGQAPTFYRNLKKG